MRSVALGDEVSRRLGDQFIERGEQRLARPRGAALERHPTETEPLQVRRDVREQQLRRAQHSRRSAGGIRKRGRVQRDGRFAQLPPLIKREQRPQAVYPLDQTSAATYAQSMSHTYLHIHTRTPHVHNTRR